MEQNERCDIDWEEPRISYIEKEGITFSHGLCLLPPAVHLLKAMLDKDPKKRPFAAECLDFSFFAKIPNETNVYFKIQKPRTFVEQVPVRRFNKRKSRAYRGKVQTV